MHSEYLTSDFSTVAPVPAALEPFDEPQAATKRPEAMMTAIRFDMRPYGTAHPVTGA